MAYINKKIDLITKFIIRRAFRCGTVSRADLLKVAGISTATATRILNKTVANYGSMLERKKYLVIPRPLAKCPFYATETDLLVNLDDGNSDALHTGLFEDELPITYVSWTNSKPIYPGILETIITAIRLEKQLDIVYLGYRLSENPRNRKILPLSLEKMNDQWRVIAQDLEHKDFPVKAFALPRILKASRSEKKIRIPYIKGHNDLPTKLHIKLDHRFSPEQKQILKNELKINNNEVLVTARSLHEFKRRFTNTPTNEDVIWPPLILEDK